MRSVLVSKQMCFTESLLNEIKMKKKTLSKHISFCPNTIKQITFICAITTSRIISLNERRSTVSFHEI